MNIYQKQILGAVDTLLKADVLPFNRKVEGVVVEASEFTPEIYKVRIKDKLEDIKSMNGTTYVIGDVVCILVFNNNESDKRILCKK